MGLRGWGGTTTPTVTGSVAGTVTNTESQALAGRSVVLRRVGTTRTTSTATNGTYLFTNVAVGDYTVEVTLLCGEPGQTGPIAVTVREDQTAVADIVVTPRPDEMLLSCDVQPIFSRSCSASGCHGSTNPQLELELHSAARTIATAVGVASAQRPAVNRIEPGDSDQTSSYLVCKIEEVCPDRLLARMPEGGPFLSQATIDTIKAWIDAGAQNN